MITIKPRFIYTEAGKKCGAIIKPKEYERLIEELENYQDFETIQEHRGEPGTPLEELKKKWL